jgi:hypothetical protein
VVNAELSFTLEQVPEWTVNDGAFVDVARPGRRPLQEEVAANLGQTAGQTGGENTPPPEPPPGAGTSPTPKPQPAPPSTSPVTCKNITLDVARFTNLANFLSTQAQTGTGTQTLTSALDSHINNYSRALTLYKNNSFYRNAISEVLSNNRQRKELICESPNNLSNEFGSKYRDKPIKDQRFGYVTSVGRLANCSRQIEDAMRQVLVNRKCPR